MRKSIAESIMGTVRDLEKIGLADDITMTNIENLCIPDVPEYTPEKMQIESSSTGQCFQYKSIHCKKVGTGC